MNRKEKFKQANREANATWLALLIVIVFWCVAGFGLADVKVEFFQTPLWVWARLHRHLAVCHRRFCSSCQLHL